MNSVKEFAKMKNDNKKISVVTCYDYWSAKILDKTNIDAVLVGDSAAMVMHGYETTVNADIEMMAFHINAVKRGIKNKLIIGDMPFLAHKKGIDQLVENVDTIMKAGANAVKIEGADGNLESIEYLVKSGVPVMGHLGLTPQSVNQLGGFKLQGKENGAAQKIINDAKLLEEAGCFSVVLELVPAELARNITEIISIPTIGIGAGPHTSGQVLVLHDLLGMDDEFKPKFLRKYLNGFQLIKDAVNQYDDDVKNSKFPNGKESY
ncbi:MAG: 3-methyl-2-oxobutanoate hydroxymethyltransferase [Melioribacteraceae bacterium]|nr:3-methyl-2-oxobutanoate hydroxymethyltransferase [Melioribacteraceae bacterium]MCF8353707.1 3-methyl-2-oxobutanoate hydroxymethyltransferase [Melioribacteraceae bacterium]MCF8394960.1 3-methyl-2-oxobutanoate hydroxymethyltransferase [Melioribacteraceae bacterium]MCF8418623.1 3-methyl-2-oxobutanoate hydroxymethyltransferase [Melioribacteraceae bacterium]